MKAAILFFECITNMHVGNGEVNYNIIDNEVERDVVTGFPTIYASGVKGALREFFEEQSVEKQTIQHIFGNDTAGASEQGKVKILAAELIATPARASKGDSPYYLLMPETAKENLKEKLQILCGKDLQEAESTETKAEAEGIALGKKLELKVDGKTIGNNLYLITDKDYRTVDLPVMSRNKLENGTSKNLWYEEVVPHKSLFYLPVLVTNEKDNEYLENFLKVLNNKIVQFGGNASIGYGLCRIFAIVGGQ